MSEFRKIFPGKDRIHFDGGMNSQFDRPLIEDNQSPDCKNVRFDNGGVRTRGGTTKLTSSTIGTFVGDGIYTRHTNDGQETMVVFCGNKMQYWTGSTFTSVPSANSVFTAGVRVAACEQEEYLFVNNGSTVPYKYNGAFTRHGVYPPTATPTVTSNATGSLTGSYNWKVTNVNTALVESDLGPATATFTAASATARVVLQTFAVSYGISARRLYRTINGGTTYKRVATISDGTTTTYDDTVADSALGVDAPEDNGVPPAWNRIVYHQSRLFMNDSTNPNYLWYTEVDSPYTVASVNFIKIGDNTSDLVIGIEKFENNILVNCSKSQFIIYMPDTDPANWLVVRVQSPYGSKSPYGCFDFFNQTMVPVTEGQKFVGFAALSGAGLIPSTTFTTINSIKSLLNSNIIDPEIDDIQETYIGNISSIVFKSRAYTSVTSGVATTTNNKLWVFDFQLEKETGKATTTWSPDTGVEAAQFTQYNSKLYFITSSSPCYVNEYETSSYNDNGVAIDSYFWTKEFSADGDAAQHTFKDFRYLKILVDKPGDYSMNLNARVDSDSGSGDVYTVDLNPGGSLWGTMVFGTDVWGGGASQEDIKVFLGGIRGERIQFKFSNQNTIAQKFNVKGLRFYFNVRGFR